MTRERDDTQRGIANRGLDERGTETWRMARRVGGGVAPTARPAPRPHTPATPISAQHWDPDALFPPGSALDLAALAKEQKLAESLMTELLPFFRKTFARGKRPYNSLIGKPVKLLVLARSAYAAKERESNAAQYRRDLAARIRFRTRWVQRQIDKYSRAGALFKEYGRITPTTRLHPRDEWVALPPTIIPTRLRPSAGFFDERDNALYILRGQTSIELIAHEMCHAYASKKWTDVQIQLSTFNLTVEMNGLDEGVTSELAGYVLFEWNDAKPRQQRLKQAPSGYVGYPLKIRNQGLRFLNVVEGGSTPGRTTMRAYFAGAVSAVVDEQAPKDSTLILNGRKFPLPKLLGVSR